MKTTILAVSILLSGCVTPVLLPHEMDDGMLCKALNKTSGYNKEILDEYKSRDIARLRAWDDVASAYHVEVGMRLDVVLCIDGLHVFDIKTMKSKNMITHILDIQQFGKRMRIYAQNGIISNIFVL